MSGGYWTIISEGTPIHENIFTIQHEYSKVTLRLSEPEMNMKTIGDRALRAYGPVQWNKFPLTLRSLSNVESKDSKTIKRQVETLKKYLKTHLFKQKQYFKSEK